MIVMIVNELFGGLARCGIPFEPPSVLAWFEHLLNIVSRRLASCYARSHKDAQQSREMG
jgi:hypothetical protein